ncbi:MAG TPA: hypothetical protein VFR15_14990 [Chloroflexia bacterium]|nr:hypothetical protein [Chloroflexia bacterium]
MATRLHNDYKFSYDNLKVLLGGWTEWKNRNAQDPAGYPIEMTPGTTPAQGQGQIQIGQTAIPIDFGPAPQATLPNQ